MPDLALASFDKIKQVIKNDNYQIGDYVLVLTDYGRHIARVCELGDKFRDITELSILSGQISKIIDNSLTSIYSENQKECKKILIDLKKIIRDNDIPMSIVQLSYSIDRDYLIVFFSSEKMVDFREIIKEINKNYQFKVRLENIGDTRQAASIIGGYGICGKNQCCTVSDVKYLDINKNQIKNQRLAPNPINHLGNCSKLRCCLNFEDNLYKELKSRFPEKGTKVKYEKEVYFVSDYKLLKNEVVLEKNDTDGKKRITTNLSDISW